MSSKKLRYWDSDTFLAYLSGEPDKAPKCMGVIQAIEKGEVEIITSALTMVEVLYLKGHPKVTTDTADKITEFFQSDFITVVNVDRKVADIGRDLVMNNGVKPKDAIHLATAILVNNTTEPIECFDTFDEGLIRISGRVGNPPIRICQPNAPFQETLIN